MQLLALTMSDYIASLAPDRREVIEKLRKVIKESIPEGFVECICYGMIGYVVPHELYHKGYHCNPELPLPFVSLGSQKSYIVLHHMALYVNPELLERWV